MKKKNDEELTLDEIEKIFQKANFFSWISLTGGEHFLRKDFLDIARILSKKSKELFLLNTTTNGYFIREVYKKAKELSKLNIPKIIIVVSLDGPKKIHDNVRGVNKSWENAIETYMLLKNLKKIKNFKTFLGYTISPFNIGKFTETYKLLKDHIPCIEPKDVHINLFHKSEHYFSNLNSVSFREKDKEAILNELQR